MKKPKHVQNIHLNSLLLFVMGRQREDDISSPKTRERKWKNKNLEKKGPRIKYMKGRPIKRKTDGAAELDQLRKEGDVPHARERTTAWRTCQWEKRLGASHTTRVPIKRLGGAHRAYELGNDLVW